MSVATKTTSTFHLQQNFFGLNDEYMQSVYEEIFVLKYYGNWSFIESYNLPIGLRNWFVKRLVKQKQEEAEQVREASTTSSATQTLGPTTPAPPKL